jgi:putative endonuclease
MLRLKSGRLYPGATTDLDQRWLNHRSGRGGRTTAIDPPISMVYRESFESFSEARQREAQIKRWSTAKEEALVSGDLVRLRKLARSS